MLQMNKPCEAMRTLRQAAAVLQESTATPTGPDSLSPRSADQAAATLVVPTIMSLKLLRDDVKMDSDAPLGSSSCSSPFPQAEAFHTIYDRALFVCNSEQDDELLSASILFNMALLHHLRGLEQNKSVNLSKASRLYETGLLILERCAFDSVACPSLNLLRLALLNNSIQIHLLEFDRDGVDECLFYMQSILDDAIMKNLEHDNHEDFSFFFSSAMMSSPDVLNLAPAA